MKKLLIASTALVATAGMASADITISGSAAAGIHSGLHNPGGTTAQDDGVYSNAGVAFALSGATDNGISFSASVDVMAGSKIDAGDFELDPDDDGAMDLGAVSMSGTFGTLTFDNGGIENLYSDSLTNADVSYATTIGAVSLTIAHDTADVNAKGSSNSISAAYSASGMDFTLAASEATAGTSAKVTVAYALNDSVSLTGKSDQAAGGESVQTIGAKTTLNGVSVSVSSANNSTWDVDLGYTAGAFALTYGVDETDGWTATATSALGGGATFAAGVDNNDSMYAGVSFAF
ncbi:porin [Amylibacter sp.]|nr:porin [Amylibacter sp.]